MQRSTTADRPTPDDGAGGHAGDAAGPDAAAVQVGGDTAGGEAVGTVATAAGSWRPPVPSGGAVGALRVLGRVPLDRSATVGAIAAVVLGGAVVVWALVLRAPSPPPIEESLPFASGATTAPAAGVPSTTTTTVAPTVLVVHAAGAVAAPGVHEVAAGSRVADVLAAAGGPAPDADLDAVNLAAPVADGDRVWFPRVGEVSPGQLAPGPAPPGLPGDGSPAGRGPIDLNTATAEELDDLPGIGPATAAAIVEHRDRNGPFRSVEDLIDVPGIGPAKLARLRPLVTVR